MTCSARKTYCASLCGGDAICAKRPNGLKNQICTRRNLGSFLGVDCARCSGSTRADVLGFGGTCWDIPRDQLILQPLVVSSSPTPPRQTPENQHQKQDERPGKTKKPTWKKKRLSTYSRDVRFEIVKRLCLASYSSKRPCPTRPPSPDQTSSPKSPQKSPSRFSPDGDEPLILRVKTTTAFQKIFNAVATQKNAALGSFRLQYDGQNLLPNETTPADLNFDDEEVLDYFVQAIGG
ncbi:hypothetical protein PGT21_008329 [Puccinia graminis f. sp. tritici]|uniref:Rad60/SUMO-like domain-containing protein n=1 Tax=Puccinia graminis f. sp. tritici TaxID=56615 RepID=A0A5B0MVV8_PUCGR|nr:hypothetical protein PGT21_008329 [Puccinia graminis f. sp. tritici]